MIWSLRSLIDYSNTVKTCIDGKWVPVRPLAIDGWQRVRAAWLVLIGKADAFTWPEGQ